MKINLSKHAFVLVLSAVTAGFFVPCAQADEVLANEMYVHARECQKSRNVDCLKKCVAAGDAAENNDGNAQAAVAECNKAYNELKTAQEAAQAATLPSSDVLMANHAWMPDIVGELRSSFMPHAGYRIEASGRADWKNFCNGYARILVSAFGNSDTERKLLVPGTRVRFGKLQYNKLHVENRGHRSCWAGEYEILQ